MESARLKEIEDYLKEIDRIKERYNLESKGTLLEVICRELLTEVKTLGALVDEFQKSRTQV